MIFHKDEMFNEFVEISKQAENQHGKDKFNVDVQDDEVIINVIDAV